MIRVLNKSISECRSEQIINAYSFTPSINFCVPECCKHETLLSKMEAKLNIEGLGHDLGLAREVAVSTRQEGTDGRNSQPGRNSELQCLQLSKPGGRQQPLHTNHQHWSEWENRVVRNKGGNETTRNITTSLIITWLLNGKISLKKQDVVTELRNRSCWSL